jgi:hypothetical protein
MVARALKRGRFTFDANNAGKEISLQTKKKIKEGHVEGCLTRSSQVLWPCH